MSCFALPKRSLWSAFFALAALTDAGDAFAQPVRSSLGAGQASTYSQAQAALHEGNLDAAKSACDSIVRANSRAFQAYICLGIVADRQGRVRAALDAYERALAIVPDHEAAVEGLIALYLRRDQRQNALSLAGRLATRWSDNLALQALYIRTLREVRRFDQAWQVTREALRKDERFVPVLVEIARVALAQGRQELAESIINQALKIDDGSVVANNLQGEVFAKRGALQKALEHFRKAADADPYSVEALLALATQYIIGANYQEALALLERSIKLAPQIPEVRLALAEAYRSLGQWAKAKRAYDLVLFSLPQSVEVHYNLGLMYMSAGENFPDMSKLEALTQAQREFELYLQGVSKPSDKEIAQANLRDLKRQIDRERRRIEREAQSSSNPEG